MKIPYFMSCGKHTFAVAPDVFDKVVAGLTTHIEYATSNKLSINDTVILRPYGHDHATEFSRVVHGKIKSIDNLPVKSGNPFNKLIGLNVQLILF